MHAYKENYPRPQLVRDNFELLDGEWNFAFDQKSNLSKGRLINVPFTYETLLSGINEQDIHEEVWYERNIEVKSFDMAKERLLLHFEGADFETTVFVNGSAVGTHKGGYARFSFDISDYVKPGTNVITVRCIDCISCELPRGKQRWKSENFGCWYVQTTGIWKSVWMEYVPAERIESVKITPLRREKSVEIELRISSALAYKKNYCAKVCISYEGKKITEASVDICRGVGTLRLYLDRKDIMEWGVFEWNTWSPCLYDVEITMGDDKVSSYFGLRDIECKDGKVLLNGRPIYQRLILDQGYWPDSHLTPPSEEALIKDIDSILALGYNGVRKHQKTEDERFLYWCDVKGVLVWSEMAAAYEFSDEAVTEFTNEWMEIVRQNYSHPCIITWTPFNESWGIGNIKKDKKEQNFTESIYHLTKAYDGMRPVIVNDGWEHTVSDIITLHDYEESGEVFFKRYTEEKEGILNGTVFHCGDHTAFAEGYDYHGQPVIISEFGGIAFNEDGGWGYGNKVTDKDAFIKRFDSITTAIKKLPYVCGFCYTQVSDVQQEINGLMTEAREYKIDPEIIKNINIK